MDCVGAPEGGGCAGAEADVVDFVFSGGWMGVVSKWDNLFLVEEMDGWGEEGR